MADIEKLAKSGIFISKTTFIVATLVVILVIIGEGLIIGLVGRPDCSTETYVATQPITTEKVETTTTNASTSTATTVVVTPPQPETGPWQDIRLPKNLIPYDYVISLRPVLTADEDGKYWFHGSATIYYTCEIPTEFIIIHSRSLNYAPRSFSISDGSNEIDSVRNFYYLVNDYLVIETITQCEKGRNYILSFTDFTGELGDDLLGLYRSEYYNEAGEHRVIAITQMQPTEARKAFPCFDEPEFKATFTTTLLYEKDTEYFAISNMPESTNRTETIDGKEWIAQTFEKTVRMPTYLLAFAVCDFSYVESFTNNEVQTRIYGRSEVINNGEGELAQEVTPKLLEFFEDYVNVNYSLSKSDQIGVTDFGAGAMENWGLVVYREAYLFYDEQISTVFDRMYIVSIISHELAHQWFGNLVSPVWWDNIWLNEGFATYLSYVGEDNVRPTWESMNRFVTSELQRAMVSDSLTTSHPLINDVSTKVEIYAMFDTISYSKGGSVLRMINGFLGDDTFVNGLTNYLNEFAYGNVAHGDLFNQWTIQAEADNVYLPADLETILETWTLQMGYPVVTCVQQQGFWVITQDYFLSDPDSVPVDTVGSEQYGYKWYVPFTYKTSHEIATDNYRTTWITPDIGATISGGSDYILGNIDAVGYYRVNYETSTWYKIADKLRSNTFEDISKQNRAQLIDDAFKLASGQRLQSTTALEMSSYMYQEFSYFPWYAYENNIEYYEYMLGRTPVYGNFEKYIQMLVVPSIYTAYGWQEENKDDDYQVQSMAGDIAVDLACYYGSDDCIAKASSIYRAWMNDPPNTSIIGTLYRTTTICTAIRSGGLEEWEFAWDQYKSTKSSQLQTSLRYGMSCSKDPWILNRYLLYCLDSTMIRKQDASSTMRYIGGQNYGRDIAWGFLVENWDTLVELFDSWSFGGVISAITQRFSTEYELHLLEDWKNSTDNLGAAEASVNQAIESTKLNIIWRANNEAIVTDWINNYVANNSA